MSFRIVTINIAKNGAKDTLASDIEKSEVTIGRGSDSEINIPSRFVSLHHAKLSITPQGLIVQDLGSLGGIEVNGKVVAREVLKAGDVLTIGDTNFKIGKDAARYTLTRELQPDGAINLDEALTRDEAILRITKSLPSIAIISLALGTILGALYLVLPMIGKNETSWSSGPISNAHKFIEHDCKSCHDGGFKHISDEKCLTCHSMAPHAAVFKEKKIAAEGSCAHCHLEHNGEHGAITRDERSCAKCHSNIKDIHPESKIANLGRWENHPEFSVPVVKDDGTVVSVRLDDKANLADNTKLAFNHKIHLEKPLQGRDGEVTLKCADCHSGKGTMPPIKFDKNCRSCHSLEFDRRLPGKEVPHGNPDNVFEFLYASYAAVALAAADDPTLSTQFDTRQIPGEAAPQNIRAASRQFALTQSRDTERTIFTKTGCALCHSISRVDTPADDKSGFKVEKATIPEVWMKASRFKHAAHEFVQCESCHKGVKESEKTTDLLLPSIATCRSCHGEKGMPGKVSSDCTLCHAYHDSLPLEDSKKRKL